MELIVEQEQVIGAIFSALSVVTILVIFFKIKGILNEDNDEETK